MKKLLRIIVADDHKLVRRGLVSLLEEMEIAASVAEVANGKEALDLLQSNTPGISDFDDLILMDVEMPVMDGIAATCQISALYPRVKVLMLTMMNNSAIIRQSIAAGAKGFVFKNA